MKVGVIGVGNMGSQYTQMILDHTIPGMELGAVTRIKPQYVAIISRCKHENIPVYYDAEELLNAVQNNKLSLDAVIITTPQLSHAEIAVRAFDCGLHVLCDKPSGVYLSQATLMNRKAAESGKCFGMVFNQRTSPLYQRMKEIVASGIYGKLKRVNWIVTDWYRPEPYYKTSSWKATWSMDGGGVLLNQCPHNLDLLQWICGMPVSVQGFCHNGRFHDIEVEDDVTAYLQWENGANGTFITSTGDAPGINRLEISLEEAMLVCENGELRIGELAPELGMKEEIYRKTSTDFFRKINGVWKTEKQPTAGNSYQLILTDFAKACEAYASNETYELIAPGAEGRNSLLLTNAVYLSSWEHRMVTLPLPGTPEEQEFEIAFKMKMATNITKHGISV